MKLEVFPCHFKGKAKMSALRKGGGGRLEIHGAKELYDLYMAGVSFRPMPGTVFEAVVFDLNDVTPEYADRLDNLSMPGVLVAKSPSAILGVDGKIYRRKVFYQLPGPVKYESYGKAYTAAFAGFILDAGLPLLTCNQCMYSPRQMTFGRPFPETDKAPDKAMGKVPGKATERTPIEGLTNARAPLPLSRHMAKAIFGIDDDIPLPPIEFHANGPVLEGERPSYIWQRIVPAAFSWFRYFEDTSETRWGLDQAGYRFTDCKAAIREAMLRIGVGIDETEAVIRGALYEAYTKFKAPALTCYRTSVTITKKIMTRWERKTPAMRKRASELSKAKRRRLHASRPRKPRPPPPKSPGRPRKVGADSLDALEALWAEGKISKPYYFRLRKELGGAPRKRGPRPSAEKSG